MKILIICAEERWNLRKICSHTQFLISAVLYCQVLPLDWLDKLAEIASKYDVPLHMDGARLMSAAVWQKLAPSRIVRDFHSVNICLSKNLGCPVGSVLIGEKNFIER